MKELGRRMKSEDEMIDMFPAQEADEKIKLHAWDEHKMTSEGAPEIQLDLEPAAEDELSALRPTQSGPGSRPPLHSPAVVSPQLPQEFLMRL